MPAAFLLFIPAAAYRTYSLFLVALFIGASGATFLETVANPYVTRLGDEGSAPFRINLAQSFNGIGAFIAPIIGGKFILSGIEHSREQLAVMRGNGTLEPYLSQEAAAVRLPYLILGLIVLALMITLAFIPLPEMSEGEEKQSAFSFKIFRHQHLNWAIVAQLFYVGAQAGIGSFFIRYARQAGQYPEKQAAYLWGSIAMVGFMCGRFAGTFLLKYIKAPYLLLTYALTSTLLVVLAVVCKGSLAVYLLMAVPFFMSVMYPTIFAMGISGLGTESKMAAALLVMAIAGGAILPVLMGKISDFSGGNIQLAYIVPAICFAVIAVFAFRFRNILRTSTIDLKDKTHEPVSTEQ